MEKEAEEGYENRLVPKEKQKFRLQIPYNLRFPLIWTLFFAVLGIVIQSIKAGTFVFADFFWANYIDWFKSFGSFTDPAYYGSEMDVILAILRHWYYFFYTGGLISLIWAFVHWLINFEFIFKTKEKKPEVIQEQNPERRQIFVQREKPKEPREELPKQVLTNPNAVIEAWLQQGYQFLSERNIEEAKLIYNEIKREYNPEKDPTGIFYIRISQFYEEILRTQQNPD